jgi:Ser/Thr protein kinase RdoA (MazF antagonist)
VNPPERRLPPAVQARLDSWLGSHELLADMSWPGQQTAVLELRSARAGRVVAKVSTGAAFDHHIARAVHAHEELDALLGEGFAELLHADVPAGVMVTRYLCGRLAEGSPWELDPAVFRGAGALVARVHSALPPQRSTEYQRQVRDRCVDLVRRARGLLRDELWQASADRLATVEPGATELVWTHGDVQPRNWLVDPDRREATGTPRTLLIDFGRADRRPWYSDLVRLHHQVFATRPDLRDAFLDGMGRTAPCAGEAPVSADELDGWYLEHLLQSLGTVVWATDMGLADFAQHGRSMLDRTLREWQPG